MVMATSLASADWAGTTRVKKIQGLSFHMKPAARGFLL